MLHVNSSVEFTDMYEGVIEDCSLEFDGSLIHKYIYILVRIETKFYNLPDTLLQRWAGDSFICSHDINSIVVIDLFC